MVQGSSAKQVAAYVPVCEPFSSGMHRNRKAAELVAENGLPVFFFLAQRYQASGNLEMKNSIHLDCHEPEGKL
jgi:hypothetical protein